MPSTNVLKRALHQRHPEPFGRYQLLGRIASGGMAEVYVARCGELAGLQTLIALKRILPVYAADDTFVRLFQREASILLRLQHAGIARVFEVGRVGQHWFVAMELVQGETLAQVSRALHERGGTWDQDLVAYIGAEVAAALHHAHTLRDSAGRPLGIVHRDISPQNIMLGFDGSVKVIDFGIARWEAPFLAETELGAVRGKIQYASPEQARAESVDQRSDVFSLGVVLYELLEGTKLFYRGTTAATLEAIAHAQVSPLPHVSPELNAVLLKALTSEPRDRFRSGAALAQGLVRAMDPGRAVGPDEIANLVSTLFPERLKRWRQIQEMASAGHGFSEVLVPAGKTKGEGPVVEAPLPEALNAPDPAAAYPVQTLSSVSVIAAEGEYVSSALVDISKAARRRFGRRGVLPWFGYGLGAAVALGMGVLVGPLLGDTPEPHASTIVHAVPIAPQGPTVEPIVRPPPRPATPANDPTTPPARAAGTMPDGGVPAPGRYRRRR